MLILTPYFEELLPPATKLGQGYIFTGICDSVNKGGGCVWLLLGGHVWLLQEGGHVWLLLGGCGCSGGCVIFSGGACVVFFRGACVVFSRGGCFFWGCMFFSGGGWGMRGFFPGGHAKDMTRYGQ